jgi:hypothetical protein
MKIYAWIKALFMVVAHKICQSKSPTYLFSLKPVKKAMKLLGALIFSQFNKVTNISMHFGIFRLWFQHNETNYL